MESPMLTRASRSLRRSYVAILTSGLLATLAWTVISAPGSGQITVLDTGAADGNDRPSNTSPSNLDVNSWTQVPAQDVSSLVDYAVPVPITLPTGFSFDGKASVMPWDVDGDGAVDLVRVSMTLTPIGGPSDENGHGNITIVVAPARDGALPDDFAQWEAHALQRADGGVARAISTHAGSSALAWVEKGGLVQLGGDASLAVLTEVAQGLS